MTTYYSKHDLSAHNALVANHLRELDTLDEQDEIAERQYADALANYQELHAAWVDDPTLGGDVELPEPQPPDKPEPRERPEPPTPSLPEYEARDADEVEELQTQHGTAIVLPGRVVLSGDGIAFALTPDELTAGYVETSEADLS